MPQKILVFLIHFELLFPTIEKAHYNKNLFIVLYRKRLLIQKKKKPTVRLTLLSDNFYNLCDERVW